MRKIGLEIAQPGKNLLTASDVEKAFSTQFSTLPVFRIHRQDFSIASGASPRQTIKHGLPFVPYYLIFYKSDYLYPDRWQIFPGNGDTALSPLGNSILLDRVDKENISFITNSNAPSTSIISVAIVIFAFPIALSL